MKRFNNFNLSNEEWDEIFKIGKNFKDCDIVEYVNCLWEIVGGVLHAYKTFGEEEKVYKLSKLFDCECNWKYYDVPSEKGSTAVVSSTFLCPIGTFIDDDLV
jgi:hypothetical protein